LFIEQDCKAQIFNNTDWFLVSKNTYLIGIVSYNAKYNTYYFFTSQSACRLSIVNLLELTLTYLVNKNSPEVFHFYTDNSIIRVRISLYFIEDTHDLLLSNLKQEKVQYFLTKYDQVQWI
jgi:hypothetical protein